MRLRTLLPPVASSRPRRAASCRSRRRYPWRSMVSGGPSQRSRVPHARRKLIELVPFRGSTQPLPHCANTRRAVAHRSCRRPRGCETGLCAAQGVPASEVPQHRRPGNAMLSFEGLGRLGKQVRGHEGLERRDDHRAVVDPPVAVGLRGDGPGARPLPAGCASRETSVRGCDTTCRHLRETLRPTDRDPAWQCGPQMLQNHFAGEAATLLPALRRPKPVSRTQSRPTAKQPLDGAFRQSGKTGELAGPRPGRRLPSSRTASANRSSTSSRR